MVNAGEMIMTNALLKRIIQEEIAKTKTCGVIGCNNQATHTWSGHPTCDDCMIPMWKDNQSVSPALDPPNALLTS